MSITTPRPSRLVSEENILRYFVVVVTPPNEGPLPPPGQRYRVVPPQPTDDMVLAMVENGPDHVVIDSDGRLHANPVHGMELPWHMLHENFPELGSVIPPGGLLQSWLAKEFVRQHRCKCSLFEDFLHGFKFAAKYFVEIREARLRYEVVCERNNDLLKHRYKAVYTSEAAVAPFLMRRTRQRIGLSPKEEEEQKSAEYAAVMAPARFANVVNSYAWWLRMHKSLSSPAIHWWDWLRPNDRSITPYGFTRDTVDKVHRAYVLGCWKRAKCRALAILAAWDLYEVAMRKAEARRIESKEFLKDLVQSMAEEGLTVELTSAGTN